MKNTQIKEIRQLSEQIESTDRVVSGYAVVFDSPSKNIGWIETIQRGAITEETIANSDVLAKLDHDDSKVLACSKRGVGSLKLELDDTGLKYSFESPNTQAGNELLEYIKRGDITGSSFCFTVSRDEGSEKWYKEDGMIYRTIMKIDKLYDISPVFLPAYEETSCSKRFAEIELNSKEIDNKMNLLKAEIDIL